MWKGSGRFCQVRGNNVLEEDISGLFSFPFPCLSFDPPGDINVMEKKLGLFLEGRESNVLGQDICGFSSFPFPCLTFDPPGDINLSVEEPGRFAKLA